MGNKQTGLFYSTPRQRLHTLPTGQAGLSGIGSLQPALLLHLVLFTWIITKFICYPLWLGDRDFPIVPVHDILLQLPAYWHAMLFWGTVFLMAAGIVFPRKKIMAAIVLLELISCLLDQNRWQPWEYQFLFMLAAYVFIKGEEHLITAWQIVLLGLYFFSGLNKLNAAFIHDVWNGLLLRNWLGIYTTDVFIFRLGYALPLVEMAAAILLCFARFRKWGLFILIGMHIMIFLVFGPLGLNRNEVIWPWNILMPVILILLFYRRSFLPLRSFFRQPFSWLVLACFCILPWLHLAGRWDHYLSFTLYSGGIPHLYICTDDAAALHEMSVFMGTSRNGMIPCRFPVGVSQWGIKVMKTAAYPQQRVYRSIARQWKKQHPNAAVKFYIYTSGFKPTLRELIP